MPQIDTNPQTRTDRVDLVVEQWRLARPDLDTSAMAALGRISRAQYLLNADLHRLHRRFGIDPRAFDILATLYRSGTPSLTPGELARHTMVGNAAMSNRLDQLVERGWITRDVNEQNRRELRIALTESGTTKIEEVLDEHVALQHDLLADLTDSDISELSRILRIVLSPRDAV